MGSTNARAMTSRPMPAATANDVRNPPEGFVRKLWRLGFQASLPEVLSVGAALQFALAERNGGRRTAYVVGSQALVDHVAEAGLRVVNHTPFATRARSELIRCVMARPPRIHILTSSTTISRFRGRSSLVVIG